MGAARMNKLKAMFVTAVILILAGGFIWSLWRNSIWSYYVVMQMLGWYGYVMAGIHMYKWLSKEEDPNTPTTWGEWAEYKG